MIHASHRLGTALSFLTAVLVASSAVAQQPPVTVVTATYERVDPKDRFSFKWKEKDGGTFTRTVGLLHWQVPSSEPGKAGMALANGQFRTFCAEALVGVVAGRTYKFEVQLPETPEAFGLPITDAGKAEAVRRATYIRELFGRYYPTAIKADDPDAARAFQVALWEIIHESQLPDAVPAPFSLFGGNFQADYPNPAASPAFVQRAETYLQSLTGDDLVFIENPDLGGRQLVRLKGVANAAGEVAQAQFALQYTTGGAVGFNGASGSGGGTGGLPGLGGGRGSPGGFGGGGGTGSGGVPFAGLPTSGSPDSPSALVPNVPINDTPPSTTDTNPPTTVPPDTTTPKPPVGGNPPGDQPPDTNLNHPVPAPPGVLLGIVAVGLVVGRKVMARVSAPRR